MQVDGAIDAFLSYIRVEKGLADNTVEAYGRDLAALAKSLHKQGVVDVGAVREADITAHLIALAKAGTSARTQARHLVAVRQLFTFLLRDACRNSSTSPRSIACCSSPI